MAESPSDSVSEAPKNKKMRKGDFKCAFCKYSFHSKEDLSSHFTDVHERKLIHMEEDSTEGHVSLSEYVQNCDDIVSKIITISSKNDESKSPVIEDQFEISALDKALFYNSRRGTPVMAIRGFEYLKMAGKHLWRCRLNRKLSCSAKAYQRKNDILVKGEHCHNGDEANFEAIYANISPEMEDSHIQPTEKDVVKVVVEEYFSNTGDVNEKPSSKPDEKNSLEENSSPEIYPEEIIVAKRGMKVLMVTPNTLKCQYCDYDASEQFELLDHLTTQHGGKILTKPKISSGNSKPESSHDLGKDEARMKPKLNQNQSHENQKPNVECRYCPFTSSNITLLKLHEKDHIKLYGLPTKVQPTAVSQVPQVGQVPQVVQVPQVPQVVQVPQEQGRIRRGNLNCETCDYTSLDTECLASHFK